MTAPWSGCLDSPCTCVEYATHICTYRLWTGDRWISTSKCHYGRTVDLPAPGLKPGRRAA